MGPQPGGQARPALQNFRGGRGVKGVAFCGVALSFVALRCILLRCGRAAEVNGFVFCCAAFSSVVLRCILFCCGRGRARKARKRARGQARKRARGRAAGVKGVAFCCVALSSVALRCVLFCCVVCRPGPRMEMPLTPIRRTYTLIGNRLASRFPVPGESCS